MLNYEKLVVHEPVLVNEVIKAFRLDNAHLKIKSPTRRRFIDATLGMGGHSVEIIKHGGKVLGIEMDPEMMSFAEDRLKKACPPPHRDSVWRFFKIIQDNFVNIEEVAKSSGFTKVDGIIFDLGVATPQLISSDRGFSFTNEESLLDMRLSSATQGVTAADLVNSLGKKDLVKLFREVMNSKDAIRLANSIHESRKKRRLVTVGDFLAIVGSIIKPKKNLHVGTLPFLALRIAVNSELYNLTEALPQAFRLLVKFGRLVVISFHSLEDEIVKKYFRELETVGVAKILTVKPIVPEPSERINNPRSRSAKLRILEKV